MAQKDWPRGRGEASSLSNLKIITHQLDPNYDLIGHDLKRENNRLLKVFSLVPRTQGRASFLARVDDGSPSKSKDPELDFDVENVSDEIKKDFKSRKPRLGYLGHHTNRSPSPNERIFDVEIKAPWGVIFEGEVSFNATFEVSVSESTNVTASLSMTVTRAKPPAKE